MPRGTRAVPADESELSENLHHRHDTNTHTFVSPLVDVLDVTCWCERAIVRVAQYTVRWEGLTVSCGRFDCEPPEGVEAVTVGPVVAKEMSDVGSKVRSGGYLSTLITERYERSEWAQRKAERGGYVQRVLPRPPGSPRRRGPSPVVAERRDRVAVLWRAGLRAKDIAEKLGMSVSLVQSDVLLLQGGGQLSRRYRLKSSG